MVVVLVALGALGGLHEVSIRRRLTRAANELAEARALLAERKDLASVGQLVSGLAHELTSPLQGVLGNTELMLASPQLLAFTETSTLSRRWHDINAIVQRAVAACRGELESSGAHVEIAGTERLPLVYIDGRQLEKVILTLLARPVPDNAVAGATRAESNITVTIRRGNDRLLIDIDDPSNGRKAEELSWPADTDACRRVLEAHGGSLEVESRSDGGFRFHLELPIAGTEGATTSPSS